MLKRIKFIFTKEEYTRFLGIKINVNKKFARRHFIILTTLSIITIIFIIHNLLSSYKLLALLFIISLHGIYKSYKSLFELIDLSIERNKKWIGLDAEIERYSNFVDKEGYNVKFTILNNATVKKIQLTRRQENDE